MILAAVAIPARAEIYLHTNLKCVSPAERREVHIYRNSYEVPGGPACRVDYLKAGETETLWTAQNSVEFCETKAQELADRLEGASFKCVATATFDHGEASGDPL